MDQVYYSLVHQTVCTKRAIEGLSGLVHRTTFPETSEEGLGGIVHWTTLPEKSEGGLLVVYRTGSRVRCT
jgi:hypothetical protein